MMLLLLLLLLLLWAFLAVYRLYFHPLAAFPGPKCAAVTGWYEFVHDILRKGQFIWVVEQLHERYGTVFLRVSLQRRLTVTGPIVRITPNELHIKDPEFYNELYAPSSKRRDKYANWTVLAGAPSSTFATVSHAHHRLRRSALNPFFSKRAVANAESLIWEKVQHLSRRLENAWRQKDVLRLDAAYMALTMDIITHYAYGESYHYLSEEDFKLEWKETVMSGSANGALLRQFPWALPILKAIPLWLLDVMVPKAAALMHWQRMVRKQVDTTIDNDRNGVKAKGTIFQAMLDSDLPPEEKAADRLQDEGQTLIGAGSETTAKALSFITFYLLRDKSLLQRLREELATVPAEPEPDGPLLPQLEKLPFLVSTLASSLSVSVFVG